MKSTIRMLGYVFIVSLIAIGIISTAYANPADDSPKKDRGKKSGWIGVIIQDVNERIAKKAKLDSEDGTYVKEVLKDSPADSAGIEEDDIIVELNGKKIYDSDDLVKIVRRTEPGSKVSITIVRDGKKQTMGLVVGKQKRSKYYGFKMMHPKSDINICIGNRILGLQISTLNEQLGEYFNAPDGKGVLIEEVEKESPAEKAGFKAGDIIIRIGKKTIDKAEKVRKEIGKYDEGEKVEFEILRKGTKKVLSLEIEEDGSQHNFYFHNSLPNIQKFYFDDAELNLKLDELPAKLEKLQPKLKQMMKNLEIDRRII